MQNAETHTEETPTLWPSAQDGTSMHELHKSSVSAASMLLGSTLQLSTKTGSQHKGGLKEPKEGKSWYGYRQYT